MLDKDSTHCAILSLLAISAILLLWHINQMGAKSTSTPAARLYKSPALVPARLQKSGLLPARIGGLAVGPEKFAFAGGNPLMPARINGTNLADMAKTIGAYSGHIVPQPIQSRVNKDSLGVTSGRIFGMRK